MSIITKYLFLVVIQCTYIFGNTRIPTSPCPDIFLYKFENGMWFGDITVYLDTSIIYVGNIELTIHFVINEKLEGYPEDISLMEPNETIKKIKEGKPLRYRFPFLSYYKLPYVIGILLNNISICSGPDVLQGQFPKSTIYKSNSISWPLEPPKIDLSNKVSSQFQPSVQRPSPPPFQPPVQRQSPPPFQPPVPRQSPPPIQRHTPSPPRVHVTNTPKPYYPDAQPQESYTECGISESQYPNPWLVGLMKYEGRQELYCTGVLISSRHVITAAHCANSNSRILINLGTNNLSVINIARYSLSVYSHEEYDHLNRYADLSIISMNEEVTLSVYVRPICLWQKEYSQVSISGRSLGFIGWQANQNKLYDGSLIEKNIFVTDLHECNSFQSNFILDNMICTSDDTHFLNGCSEIVGGFLIDSINNKITLRGIFTASNFNLNSANCNANSHCIFTDIIDFLDWIKLYIRIS